MEKRKTFKQVLLKTSLLLALLLLGLGGKIQAAGGQLYESQGANIRNWSGEKIGYLPKDALVMGRLKGDYVEIEEKGAYAKIHKSVLKPVNIKADIYESLGANIRNMKDEKVGYLAKETLIRAYLNKDYVYFIYKGERVRVHKNFIKLYYDPNEKVSLAYREEGWAS